MAVNSSSLQETILKAIDAVVTQRNNDLKLDKTITGIIKKNAGIKKGGKPVYEVEYSGGVIEAMTQYADDIYTPKTSVYVLVPQGNFSKDKIIIGRASSISTDRSSSVVAAAVNKYSIVGSNLLESKLSDKKISDLEFGLRSFHEKEKEEIEGNLDSINHRAYFIYRKDTDGPINFSDDRLNIYKEESSAIMIKADFKTNLDIAQKNQGGARYGLIFNFAFDNLNKGWGETNGEILEKVSKIVSGIIEVAISSGTTTQEITWEDYVINDFYNRLIDPNITNDDVENWISDDGLLDQESENTQALYQVFQVKQPELNKDIIKNTVQAYLALLQELKGYTKIASMKQRYNEWLEEKVGDSSQKFEQFVLTSDSMIGNPFSFNNWNTQYSVFEIDLETFNHLDSILFYHQGFIQDVKSERNWPLPKRYDEEKDQGGPDIFVRNLQVYAMNPLDAQSGDYTLKVEPAVGMDMIISSTENPTTQFKATLMRKMYEDLTANAKVSYYWFKESPYVINADSTGYHYLGGPGWRKMEHNETNYLFTSSVDDNLAYKNNYKCVAVYEPAADDKTILSCLFTIYNKDKSLDIKLESDIGTKFSFDAGAPTITVLINRNRLDENSLYKEEGANPETDNPEFLYHWTIEDASNGYPLFLEEIISEVNTVQDVMLLDAKQDLLKRIEKYVTYWKKSKVSNTENDTEDDTEEIEILVTDKIETSKRATRIKYPVSISSSGFVVTCYVQQWSEIKKAYIDVGSANLEFENQDEAIVSDYYIQIINGDQVFQYDEYGKSPCDESKKDPLIIKPLQAKLFTPKGTEVTDTNYTVEWIIPIENTMLSTNVELQRNPNTNLVQNYTGSELTFSIAKLYDYNAYNNQITCYIRFKDKDYYKDTNFYVGKIGNNGTNGTDIISKIVYTGKDIANVLHYQPLTLYVQATKNEDGTIKHQGMWNVGTSVLKDEVAIISEQDGLGLNVYQKGSLLGSSNFNMGYPHWNVAGNASGTTNNTARFFSLGDSGQSLTWKYDTNSDEKFYQMQNIRAEVSIKDDKEDQEDATYYAFFSLPIIKYEVNSEIEYKFIVEQEENSTVISKGQLPVNKLLPSNRIAINREFYLNEIVYNADGRNPIYNHNQGLELINLPEGAVVIWTVKGGLNAIRSGFSNSIKQVLESKPGIKIVTEKDGTEGTIVYSTLGTSLLNKARIYIRPNDTFDGAATNNRVEAQVYVPKTEIQKSQEQQAVRNAIKKKYEEKIELKYQEALSLFEDYYLKDMQNISEQYKDNEDARNAALETLSKEYGKHFLTLQDEIIKTFEGVDLTNEIAKEALKTVVDKLIANAASDTNKMDWETLRKTIEEDIIPWLPAPILEEDEVPEFIEEDEAVPDFVDTVNTAYNVQDKIHSEKREETYRELFGNMYDSIKKWSENIQEKIKNNNCTKEDLQTLQSQIDELAEQVTNQFEFLDDNFTVKDENGNEETISYYKDYLNRVKLALSDIFNDNIGSNVNITIENHLESFIVAIEALFTQAINDSINFEQNLDPMKDFNLLATVYAPIHMSLNTFGLASVNAWDGNSITIDDERGAVLAPQVAAGEKDSNNRFTGVVMGKTKTYTGDAEGEKQTGLFGYAYGLQSIFLDAETGNATFGLPEGDALKKDSKGHYSGLIEDDYGEGRIELRPGDISKIGGWRIGRRSLYYTTKLVNNKYVYDGEIGPAYTRDLGTPLGKQYGAHHEKDIKTEDGGLLLSASPPYISIKGERLTGTDIDNGLNSQLIAGDSLEIQLDPKTPTLFTIFRHNSETRGESVRGKRQFLAGINDKGELLANGVGKEDNDGTGTKSGNIILKAFKDTKDMPSGSYVGSVFEAGNGLASTRTFFQIFREKANPLNTTAQVYMTGGQVTSSGDFVASTGNEYLRPVSIHGKNIMLYADTGNPNDYILDENGEKIIAYDNIPQYDEEGKLIVDNEGNPVYNPILDKNGNITYLKYGHNWISTDANIQISTNSSQIQLGNTKLLLTRSNNNSLDTRGPLNINLGATDDRKPLALNALSSDIKLYTGAINYYNQIINTSNIKITTTKPYRYYSTNDEYKIYTHANNDYSASTDYNHLYMADDNDGEKLQIGRWGRTTTDNKGVTTTVNRNIIRLLKEEGKWETSDKISLNGWNNIEIISKTTKNGREANFSSPQIKMQAGTVGQYKDKDGNPIDDVATFILNSSNNSWTNGSSHGNATYPWFRLNHSRTAGGIYGYINVENGVQISCIGISGRTYMSQGLKIQGTNGDDVNRGLTVNIWEDAKGNKYGGSIWAAKNITANEKFYGTSKYAICDGTSSTGSGASISGLGDSGTATFSSVELQNNGRPNLHTHTISVSIPTGSTIYEEIKSSIASQISTALEGYAKKSDIPDVSNFAEKGTYTLQTNSGYGSILTTASKGSASVTVDGKTGFTSTVVEDVTSAARSSYYIKI